MQLNHAEALRKSWFCQTLVQAIVAFGAPKARQQQSPKPTRVLSLICLCLFTLEIVETYAIYASWWVLERHPLVEKGQFRWARFFSLLFFHDFCAGFLSHGGYHLISHKWFFCVIAGWFLVICFCPAWFNMVSLISLPWGSCYVNLASGRRQSIARAQEATLGRQEE